MMQNLKKLQKLVANVDGESLTSLTREELQEAMSQIIDFLGEVNKKNRGEFSQVSTKLGQDLREIRQALKADVDRYKDDLSQAAGIRIIEGFRNRLESIESRIQTRLAELQDGKDGISPDIEEVIKGIIPYIPKGSPDTGVEIRNKLEHLEGDERLSVSAIAGLDEKLKKLPKGGGGGGGSGTLYQLMDVDVVSTAPTDGQTLTYNSTAKLWKPSSAGAGDVIKVGTPANNQVGVWTGDGTIEGDAALTFDTGTNTLATEIVTVTDDAYAAGWNASTAVPTKNAVYDKVETLAPKDSPVFTTAVTLPVALTGVIRADSGVVSVDTDITDIVAAASTDAAGKVELATTAETETGTDAARAVTPDALHDMTTLAGAAWFLDEDNMASDSATKTASQQSIKAYADTMLPKAGGTMTGNITLSENTSIALDPAGSADGKYSGITVAGTAGAALAFGDLCYLDPTDSRWELADANAAAAADGDSRGILGICVLAAAGDGNATTMLLQGIVRADTAFPALTIGAPVYVSETAGDIVVTQPTTTDVVIRIVGVAITADEIFFRPDFTWVTHT